MYYYYNDNCEFHNVCSSIEAYHDDDDEAVEQCWSDCKSEWGRVPQAPEPDFWIRVPIPDEPGGCCARGGGLPEEDPRPGSLITFETKGRIFECFSGAHPPMCVQQWGLDAG